MAKKRKRITRRQKDLRQARQAELDAIGLAAFTGLAQKAGFSVRAVSDGTVELVGL